MTITVTPPQSPLVTYEWIHALANTIPDIDEKTRQLLTLFGECVALEAGREHNERMARTVELEIPY